MERVSKQPMICRLARRIWIILEMIKFEHTLFAMPFALIAMVVAANGFPTWNIIGWIIAAMVGARSAAMAFNRIADLEFDRLNPRTANRALVTGIVSTAQTWIFTLVCIGLFTFASYKLNRLAYMLSPIALFVILGYSFTKRFTAWSHIVLGFALAIAPSGAWIAVLGRLDLAPMILSASVVFWTAGFDIIYSLQDVEFDRKIGLRSLPQTFGPNAALSISRLMHALMAAALVWFGQIAHLGAYYFAGCAVVALFLIYEHSIISPSNIKKVNSAFFTMNGFVSVGLFVFVLLDLFLR
ncbi:MAG: UbiA-like polyprenyltransferase [Armatimonadota bacterium]|nr:UbiA-like polyprenyltransferase [Armatimonadota bacterium]